MGWREYSTSEQWRAGEILAKDDGQRVNINGRNTVNVNGGKSIIIRQRTTMECVLELRHETDSQWDKKTRAHVISAQAYHLSPGEHMRMHALVMISTGSEALPSHAAYARVFTAIQ